MFEQASHEPNSEGVETAKILESDGLKEIRSVIEVDCVMDFLRTNLNKKFETFYRYIASDTNPFGVGTLIRKLKWEGFDETEIVPVIEEKQVLAQGDQILSVQLDFEFEPLEILQNIVSKLRVFLTENSEFQISPDEDLERLQIGIEKLFCSIKLQIHQTISINLKVNGYSVLGYDQNKIYLGREPINKFERTMSAQVQKTPKELKCTSNDPLLHDFGEGDEWMVEICPPKNTMMRKKQR